MDVLNLIDGAESPSASSEWIEKLRPADGMLLCRVARSGAEDVYWALLNSSEFFFIH